MLHCNMDCMYFVYLLMKFFYYLEHPLSCILRPKKLFHFEYFFVNVRSGFFLLRGAFVLPRREWTPNEWRITRSFNYRNQAERIVHEIHYTLICMAVDLSHQVYATNLKGRVEDILQNDVIKAHIFIQLLLILFVWCHRIDCVRLFNV